MAETKEIQMHPMTVRVSKSLFAKMTLAASLRGVSVNAIALESIADYCSGLDLSVQPTDLQARAGATLQRMAARRRLSK